MRRSIALTLLLCAYYVATAPAAVSTPTPGRPADTSTSDHLRGTSTAGRPTRTPTAAHLRFAIRPGVAWPDVPLTAAR